MCIYDKNFFIFRVRASHKFSLSLMFVFISQIIFINIYSILCVCELLKVYPLKFLIPTILSIL